MSNFRPATFAIMAPVQPPPSSPESETTSQNTSSNAGKATARKGTGRDLKVGRKPGTTEPSLGWVSKVHGHCNLAGNQVITGTKNNKQAQAREVSSITTIKLQFI